jgi:hypothetical protein
MIPVVKSGIVSENAFPGSRVKWNLVADAFLNPGATAIGMRAGAADPDPRSIS